MFPCWCLPFPSARIEEADKHEQKKFSLRFYSESFSNKTKKKKNKTASGLGFALEALCLVELDAKLFVLSMSLVLDGTIDGSSLFFS
jgi:hypothetical protein